MNNQLPTVQPKAALMAGSRPMAIVPESIEQVWRLAELMAKSGLAPKEMDTPERCAVAILHGLEVGLSPMQAVQKIAVINGRPTIWGDAAIGLVKTSGLCESIREMVSGDGDKMVAQCFVKRVDEKDEVIRSFSVDDAKQAKLWGKPGPWQQYTKRMLQMRARGFALRDVFPDVLGGMYIREELEGSDDFKDVTPAAEPPIPPEPPSVEVGMQLEVVPVAEKEVVQSARAEPDGLRKEPETPPRQEPPIPPGGAQTVHEMTLFEKPAGTDALGGKPEIDAIPPKLKRKTETAPAFKIDAWLATLTRECEDKTPHQLLNIREKMIDPLRDRLGTDGFARAEKVWDAAREAAQQKYGPSIDGHQWLKDLEGAISGCTSIEQVLDVQKKVQQPALNKVSPDDYAKGKKLVAAALSQLAQEE